MSCLCKKTDTGTDIPRGTEYEHTQGNQTDHPILSPSAASVSPRTRLRRNYKRLLVKVPPTVCISTAWDRTGNFGAEHYFADYCVSRLRFQWEKSAHSHEKQLHNDSCEVHYIDNSATAHNVLTHTAWSISPSRQPSATSISSKSFFSEPSMARPS